MKAVFITGHGGNEVVEVREGEHPARRAGEVLVRLQAATLNQVDLYMRNSGAGITHSLPQIMGVDGAGIVEEVDADETLLTPGQRVVLHPGVACGRCEFCQRGEGVLCTKMQFLGEHRHGTFAQWISVPAENVFPMPPSLSFVQAAALGVNHLTAWRMVFTKAQLKPFFGIIPDPEAVGGVLVGTDLGEVWRVSADARWSRLAAGLPDVQAVWPLSL